MKRNWRQDEVEEHWFLFEHEKKQINGRTNSTRLGFAVLLKFFQLEGRFPDTPQEVPLNAVHYIAHQTGIPATAWGAYPWNKRIAAYHREAIRNMLGYRQHTAQDLSLLFNRLMDEVLDHEIRNDRLFSFALQHYRDCSIEPPASEQLRRLIQSALAAHETRFCNSVFSHLDGLSVKRMDTLLEVESGGDGDWTIWQQIKSDPGKAGIESIKEAVSRLKTVRDIALPTGLFRETHPKLLERYARRAAVEEPFELRRHSAPLRVTLMAAFLCRRSEELTDHLVDLLIETVHKMGKKAEKRIDSGLAEVLQKAPSKMAKLYRIAKASVEAPQGIVSDVIFPEAPEKWLQTLIKEVEQGTGYTSKVKTALQKSYRHHYRRMLPELLHNLQFRCTGTQHQPLLQALELVTSMLEYKKTTFPQDVEVPLKGIVPAGWMTLVVEEGGVNRTAYEICVLKLLREQLRCREVWVVGSRRYRDPEEDLPQDFEERKASYYAELGIPVDPQEFTASLKEELKGHLEQLDARMPINPGVKIVAVKDGHRISVTPFDPKPEPDNLTILKREIIQRWPGTSLLDVLKEADLRAEFTKFIQSGTERSHMDRDTLRRRILLCLFGMGTNTGIKSMEALPTDDYKDLLYVRRRFISIESLRQAISQVVNATLAIRLQKIWGEATTACASDSKQFGAWDQNLLTEWHLRYGGRGVMVYWHVEKNAACIYSQFKRVSSSEAAAMIQGVLRHCTEMDVERQYVDSHGQNAIAFAFCRLLGFDLMPRLKGINKQKLYKADSSQEFPNINPVMAAKSIDWELIEQHLDTAVKHAVALKAGMADAESLLRRFSRSNAQHPAYRALVELGKAIKTIFLCRYLDSEELRREVHEGLNVVESWNSTNGFIFYGKQGEISTNRRESQEMGLLCLHLLQASMVYVNTLMIQQVLTEPGWLKRMTPRDLAALSPLITQHINPYGRFELDMEKRLPLAA
ncbi:Tn3 family transposase [Trichlorobacter lovleyi]|uniref:Tn3 family transposase n=1 Tax=Trichlorobacter lovleyi TaxID=313985 RepID=UPI003D124466